MREDGEWSWGEIFNISERIRGVRLSFSPVIVFSLLSFLSFLYFCNKMSHVFRDNQLFYFHRDEYSADARHLGSGVRGVDTPRHLEK